MLTHGDAHAGCEHGWRTPLVAQPDAAQFSYERLDAVLREVDR